MKKLIALLIIVCFSCKQNEVKVSINNMNEEVSLTTDKIQVLNVGSFHFGQTSDANKTEFDENDLKNQEEVRAISQLLASFKPTIICLEYLPEQDDEINQEYRDFLKDSSVLNTQYGELSMIGFDVARRNNLKKVYGIDNHMGYNYSLGDFIENSTELTNTIDPETYLQLTYNPFKNYPEIAELDKNFDTLSLKDKLILTNNPIMLDYSLNTNADKLFYVGLEDGFEGADQAALFYNRNMRIYSNLNRIKMNKNDRVLILMGSAHTAMLREFIQRSPKFEMVNTLDYLK